MSDELDKAVTNLNNFLLQHPELQEEQFKLMDEMEGLSKDERITFLSERIKENLAKLRAEIESLDKKTKEFLK